MKLKQWWDALNLYLGEAAARIFSPSDDDYPAVGLQPFEGDVSPKGDRAL